MDNVKGFLQRRWMLLWPAAVWLVLFSPFLSGQIVINVDTNINYGLVKFFWNNVLNGVWPLWDPYNCFGRPVIFSWASGVLNPLSLLIPVQVLLGVNYYQAYITYLAVYFFVGCIGFYLLALEIYKDPFIASIGYALIVLSGLGPMLFNQVYILLLFVPATWFFYFVLKFKAAPTKKTFLGIIFCAIMAMVSYYPFYLVTVTAFVVFFSVLLFPRKTWIFCCSIVYFVRNNWKISALSFVMLLIAACPLILVKATSDGGTIVSPARQLFNIWKDDPATITPGFHMTSDLAGIGGTFAQRIGIRDILGHLDKRNYRNDDFYYLPFFTYMLIILSLFVWMNRKRLLLLLVTFSVFFIAIGVVSPIYPFLFKYFLPLQFHRNLFFYMAFLFPLIILFAIGQLQEMLSHLNKGSAIRSILLLVIPFILAWWILDQHADILLTTWLTLAFAGILASLSAYKLVDLRHGAGLMILVLVIIVEPLEVFSRFTQRYHDFGCVLPSKHVKPEFVFTRQDRDPKEAACCISGNKTFWYDMSFSDSLILPFSYVDFISLYFLRYLRSPGPVSEKRSYLRNKVLVYEFNSALDPPVLPNERSLSTDKSFLLKEGLTSLKAVSFTVNSVTFETDINKKSLLVYNDTYDNDWKVFVNGEETQLLRVNMAFKGVVLNKGRSTVTFKYCPLGGTILPWMIFTFLSMFSGFFLISQFKREEARP